MVKENFDKSSFGKFSEEEVDLKAASFGAKKNKAYKEARPVWKRVGSIRKSQNIRPVWKRVGSIKLQKEELNNEKQST